MPSSILVVRDLRKRFGPMEALRGASFDVHDGELFGLVGPNGAGKTTLLSIVACLSNATSGEVLFDGKPLRREDFSIRRAIGIGTQDLAIYQELTARENLAFFGKLYGLRGDDLVKRIGGVLEFTGLSDRADDRAGTFSGGMKRRLNLGIAVIHRPRVLLLDEPTTGVDPQSRNHIFERVKDLNNAGTTVIYTSHYMEEVESLCPRIGIIDHGRIIACDSRENLLRSLEGTIRITVSRSANEVMDRLAQLPNIHTKSVEANTIVVTCPDASVMLPRLVNVLREANADALELKVHEPNLEDVFLHLTEKTLRDA